MFYTAALSKIVSIQVQSKGGQCSKKLNFPDLGPSTINIFQLQSTQKVAKATKELNLPRSRI